MKVIDARSGKELRVGETIRYSAHEYLELVDVDEGLFSASAIVQTQFGRNQIPLLVRFFHPKFFLQKIAIIPS